MTPIPDTTKSSQTLYPNAQLNSSIRLLSIDTSTDACSVALLSNGTIHEEYVLAPKMHTQILLPMVDNLLKELSITLNELDAFAFGRGPGSFTGVRIACSMIQALSMALNKPIVPVSTLQALAQAAYEEKGLTQICAYLDARMQEYYWGLYQLDEGSGIMLSVSDEKLQSFDVMQLQSPKHFQTVTGYPHAKFITKIAAYEFDLGHTVMAADAMPVYLRDEVVKSNKPEK